MPNSFVFNDTLSSLSDCPISIPGTRLEMNSSILIGSVQLNLGQVLQIRYVGLHWPKFLSPGGAQKMSTGLPTVYFGVYYGTSVFPRSSPIYSIGLEAPGFESSNTNQWFKARNPGKYSFVLANNSASNAILASVTGVARVSS